jgi:hypothetical protein
MNNNQQTHRAGTLEIPGRPRVYNGFFTISNPRTGGHKTYRVHTTKIGGELRRVLSVLTGPDNTSSYTALAFLTEASELVVWKRYLGTQYETLAKVFHAVVRGSLALPLQESRHCTRCNRLLTDPESIDIGLGPHCRGAG